MQAGRLRDLIIIEEKPDLTDEYGEEVEVFNEVFRAKSDFRVMSGAEIVKAGASLSTEIATVLMRKDRRLKYDHFINFEGRRYRVESIKPNKKYRDIIVTVSRQIYE